MKKPETVWLIIRLIGLYFAYLAVSNVFAVITAFFILLGQNINQKEFSIFFLPLFWLILYAVVAIYLLAKGKYLFDILNSEESGNSISKKLDKRIKQLDEASEL